MIDSAETNMSHLTFTYFLWCRAVVIYHGYLDEIPGLHQHEMTLEKGKTAEHVLKCHIIHTTSTLTTISSLNQQLNNLDKCKVMKSSTNELQWRCVMWCLYKKLQLTSRIFNAGIHQLVMHSLVYCCKQK